MLITIIRLRYDAVVEIALLILSGKAPYIFLYNMHYAHFNRRAKFGTL